MLRHLTVDKLARTTGRPENELAYSGLSAYMAGLESLTTQLIKLDFFQSVHFKEPTIVTNLYFRDVYF